MTAHRVVVYIGAEIAGLKGQEGNMSHRLPRRRKCNQYLDLAYVRNGPSSYAISPVAAASRIPDSATRIVRPGGIRIGTQNI